MNTPETPYTIPHDAHDRSPERSIRRELERDAWRRHPRFARDQARRRPDRACREVYVPPRRHRRGWLTWQDRTLLILWVVLTALLLVRMSTAEASAGGEVKYGIEFRGGGNSLRTVALDTDIVADVTGLVARIAVRQRFRNTGTAWSEAIYRFPLPQGSAVDRLRIEAGGREIEGVIREKDTARRQYQQARSAGRIAALIEQERPNQFQTRLANIGPDDQLVVEIEFLAHVDYHDGVFSLNLPLTFTPRWQAAGPRRVETAWSETTPRIGAAGGLDDHHLQLGVRLRTGLSLARLESRYHDIEVHPALGGYEVFVADPDTRTDRVFTLEWATERGREPESALMTWDGGDAVYAMLMVAPPLPEAVAPQPRDVIFIIDTSGSMEGQSLRQARAALHQGLQRLGPDDRFNIIRFDSVSERLFDRGVPADPASLITAADFIDGLRANGGTNMAPALQDAMLQPAWPGLLRQIVFVTDGSVGNEGDLLLQIGEQLGASRLFTVSIGSAPNRGFMRKAAEIGRGNHTHIGKLDEVEERMAALWSRIENPALSDLCVDWGAAAETYPEVIPDLYAGEPLWLFARLPREPGEIRLCGQLGDRPWEQVRRPLPGRGSENIATLWARSKIESLEDSRVFGADPDFVRGEVTNLALDFGLLTAYTGMVAVAPDPVRPADQALQAQDVPSLLPAGSGTQAAGFAATATHWPLQLFFALLLLSISVALMWFSSPSRPSRVRHGAA